MCWCACVWCVCRCVCAVPVPVCSVACLLLPTTNHGRRAALMMRRASTCCTISVSAAWLASPTQEDPSTRPGLTLPMRAVSSSFVCFPVSCIVCRLAPPLLPALTLLRVVISWQPNQNFTFPVQFRFKLIFRSPCCTGVLRGALSNLGVQATVRAEIVKLPACAPWFCFAFCFPRVHFLRCCFLSLLIGAHCNSFLLSSCSLCVQVRSR